MSFNESGADPLYFAYKDAGPTLGLIWPAVLVVLVAIPGALMNSSVVFVTVAKKSLHGSSNFLLALMSLFEVLHQQGHLIFLCVSLSGVNFLRARTAMLLELPMVFGINAALIGMPLAAADRLFCVILPKMHSRLNKKLYLGALTALCVFYGAYFVYYMWRLTAQMPDTPISGCISDLIGLDVDMHFFRITAAFNAVSVLCYLLIWLVIRRNGGTKQTNQRLLKSLLLIISVNIGGYLISLSVYQLFYMLMGMGWDFVMVWHLSFISGISLNLSAACNAPILYWTSTEYRKAFRHYGNRLLCSKSNTSVGADRMFVALDNRVNNHRRPSIFFPLGEDEVMKSSHLSQRTVTQQLNLRMTTVVGNSNNGNDNGATGSQRPSRATFAMLNI